GGGRRRSAARRSAGLVGAGWRRGGGGPVRPRGGSGAELAVPLGDAVGLGGQHGIGIAFDLHRVDLVALGDGVHHLHALGDLAEHGVAAVQPVGLHVGDEELAAIGVRAGIGHGQDPALVGHAVAGLVLEPVARAAAAGALGAAALDHEVGDDPVEVQAVVETAP